MRETLSHAPHTTTCPSNPTRGDTGRTSLPRDGGRRSADPKRILHIFGCMNRGGAEIRALEIMRYIDPSTCDFHFCTMSGRAGALDGDIQSAGGTIHPLWLGPLFPAKFRRLLRTYRFAAVHSHVQLFSGWLLRLAHQEGIPIRIAHFHSSRDNHGGGLRRACQRRLMRYWIDQHATDIVAVSDATLAGAWNPNWRMDPRCRVIYTAVDVERFRITVDRSAVRRDFGFPDGSTMVIHVGSQQDAKNHCRLIEIFAAIVRRDGNARLLLIGRSDVRIERRIRKRAAELGVSERVVCAGERRDVPRLLNAADVMVFPSIWEGLPGAVLEACAAGLPVLATDDSFMYQIAAQCRNVRCLPLAAPDEVWAHAAEALARGRGRHDEQPTDAAPDSRLFSIAQYAREWQQVWARD